MYVGNPKETIWHNFLLNAKTQPHRTLMSETGQRYFRFTKTDDQPNRIERNI
jgi:hypothetical protein